ncbi:MAG: universal stress protein [Candidatus Electrothrix sp. AU1_5]|nr:universal stress protein [Candidatus Electrothrix gigas]
MKRFKNILLVFNESTQNKATLEQAKDLCKRNHARLTVVNVVEDVLRAGDQGSTPEVLSSLRSHDLEIRKQDLEQLVEPVRQEGIQVATKVITGTPFLQIIREVLRFKHDLVIMTAEGNGGLRERVFCSTSMHLMRKSPCPVWVVKPDHPGHYARILAAVDPDSDKQKNELAIKIMDLATSKALCYNAELHIVNAWILHGESLLRHGRAQIPSAELEKLLRRTESEHKDALDKLLSRYDLEKLQHKIHFLKGEAKNIIPALAEQNNIGLIVMGTVGRTGVPGFFIGNTAENVLNQVNSSVMAVKPEGFVTPVKLDE